MLLRNKESAQAVYMLALVIIVGAKLLAVYLNYKVNTWEIMATKVFLWVFWLFLVCKQIEYIYKAVVFIRKNRKDSQSGPSGV